MSMVSLTQERPTEPSDTDRFMWDDTTRAYVEYLEAVEDETEKLVGRRDYWISRADEAYMDQQDGCSKDDRLLHFAFWHGLGIGALIAWAAVVFLLP